MKQLIVMIAIFLLLVPLILQISTENIMFAKKNAVEFYVANATEEARQEGCYTNAILSKMKDNIAKKLKISSSSIIIDAKTTKDVKFRLDKYDKRGEIYIRVSVPFKGIIAAGDFLNIEDDQYYIVEKLTMSERIN